MSDPIQGEQDVLEQGFCGELFRQARNEKGYSLEVAAAELHLSVKQLVAIEEGRVQELPGRVFALGYLKSYARYLGLNEKEVIADYDRVTGGAAVEKQRKLKPIASQGKSVGGKRFPLFGLLLLILVVAVVAVAVLQLGGKERAADMPVMQESGSVLPVPVLSDPVAPGENGEQAVQSESALPQEETVAEVAGNAVAPDGETADAPVAEEPIAVQEEVAAVTESEQVAGGQAHLQILFSSDCWLEIRDANGNRLVSGVRGVDTPVDLYGDAPFSLTFGAPASVEMVVYNDEAVTLEENTNSSVLRLTLPLEN